MCYNHAANVLRGRGSFIYRCRKEDRAHYSGRFRGFRGFRGEVSYIFGCYKTGAQSYRLFGTNLIIPPPMTQLLAQATDASTSCASY